MNPYHEANRRRWDAAAEAYAKRVDERGLWRRCFGEPALFLAERERHWLGDLKGKSVCVLGSGDNHAVFALAGMGARVTSVDISERQLDAARRRAAELDCRIAFVRADVTDLSALADASFDAVYTGGHVAVWVSDLRRFYAEAVRLLGLGGLLMVSEYHPFRRLWKDTKERLELATRYFDRGPHVYESADDLFDSRPGKNVSYEFTWTVGDYIGAVMATGSELLAVEEFGEEAEGWEYAVLEGLPRVLLIVAKKRASTAPVPPRASEPPDRVEPQA